MAFMGRYTEEPRDPMGSAARFVRGFLELSATRRFVRGYLELSATRRFARALLA